MNVWDHFKEIVAAVIAIGGLTAIIFGRDSYVVAVVGTALGFLFGVGYTKVKGGS